MEQYLVVVNSDGHHSLWPADEVVPSGWEPVHDAASKDDALAFVERAWTDQRPATLRRWLADGHGRRSQEFCGGP